MLRLGRRLVHGDGRCYHPIKKKIVNVQKRQVWMEWTWLHNNGKDEEQDDDDGNEKSKEAHNDKKTELKTSVPPQEQQNITSK